MRDTAVKEIQGGFLPYGRQHVTDTDVEAVVDVLRSDWLTQGPTIGEFEYKLAQTVGAAIAYVYNMGVLFGYQSHNQRRPHFAGFCVAGLMLKYGFVGQHNRIFEPLLKRSVGDNWWVERVPFLNGLNGKLAGYLTGFVAAQSVGYYINAVGAKAVHFAFKHNHIVFIKLPLQPYIG